LTGIGALDDRQVIAGIYGASVRGRAVLPPMPAPYDAGKEEDRAEAQRRRGDADRGGALRRPARGRQSATGLAPRGDEIAVQVTVGTKTFSVPLSVPAVVTARVGQCR
jgi:hypothetical protein